MNLFRRVHWLVIVGVVGLVVVIGLTIAGGESPQTKAAQFMSALASADAKKLAETSYIKDVSKEEMESRWQKSVDLGKYYLFVWRISAIVPQGPDQVSVRLQVVRNAQNPSAYEEPYDLTVKKVDGKWFVDPSSLSREAYPFLPRF